MLNMKFLYVSDLHGDENKYEKILNLAIELDIKLIVNGGDLLPKLCDRHKQQPTFIKDYLTDYFQRLNDNNITYLTILGNDDLITLDTLFLDVCNDYDNIHYLAGNKIEINGYEFIGMDSILDHPFGCKDRVVTEKDYVPQPQLSSIAGISNEFDYDLITNWLEYSTTKLPYMCDILDTLPKPNNPKKTIYVMHMPPSGLNLGQLRSRDLDIGSMDICNFFKRIQPLLTLHGHIHESPDTITGKWINQIDNTTCIQPGQTELNEQTMVYVLIDLEKQRYERKVVNVR